MFYTEDFLGCYVYLSSNGLINALVVEHILGLHINVLLGFFNKVKM